MWKTLLGWQNPIRQGDPKKLKKKKDVKQNLLNISVYKIG